MKTKLFSILACLILSTSAWACAGISGACQIASSCDCVDPACGAPYSCMSPGYCCAAFGNIGATDTPEPMERTVYSADDFPGAFVEPARKHYRHHYRPRVYHYKGE